jgi:hypothetical protein
VQTREEVDALKKATVFETRDFSPRLQRDHPTGAKTATVRWIGK